MENLGTWLAIGGVAIGFVILVWLLFADTSQDKQNQKKK